MWGRKGGEVIEEGTNVTLWLPHVPHSQDHLQTHNAHAYTDLYSTHTHIHTPCMYIHDTYTRYTYITDNTHTCTTHIYAYHTHFFFKEMGNKNTSMCVKYLKHRYINSSDEFAWFVSCQALCSVPG